MRYRKLGRTSSRSVPRIGKITRRSIDILNGETALINANADAASAETDVLIGQLSLLAAMGQLDFAAIR